MEVQSCALRGSSPNGEGEAQDSSEALMLSRGLELSSPPSVHQVLDGQPLLRWVISCLWSGVFKPRELVMRLMWAIEASVSVQLERRLRLPNIEYIVT